MSLLSVRKQEIIKEIERDINRGSIVDGVYKNATFTYNKSTFTITSDVYDNAGNRTGSCITKNGKPYSGSIVSNGRYRNVALYNGASLMEHQLLAVCLIPGATDELLDETTNNIINHKTIARASVDARESKAEYDKQVEMCAWGGEEPDESLIANPPIPPCDVRDLEICTSAENYAHGAFIKEVGLYDYPILAHDINLLKKFMINENQVKYILNIYLTYGAEVMNRMFIGC